MLAIISAVVSVIAVVASATIGASEIRELRRKTGDTSVLTAILSGEAFSRRQS